MSAQFYLLRICMSLEPGDIVRMPEWVFFMAAREERPILCQGVDRIAMMTFTEKISKNWEFVPKYEQLASDGQRCVEMMKPYPPDRRRYTRMVMEESITFDPGAASPITQTITTKEIDHGEATFRYVKRPPYNEREWRAWNNKRE